MRGKRHAPADFYHRERPGSHCTGGWVGPKAGLDGGKSRPTGIRSPDRPARSQSLYLLSYWADYLTCVEGLFPSVLYILFSSCQLALFGYPDWGFSVLFLSCKANARVYLAKTGHGPHSSKLGDNFYTVSSSLILVWPLWVRIPKSLPAKVLFVSFCVLFVCKCVLYSCHRVFKPVEVNKYIKMVNCRSVSAFAYTKTLKIL